MLCCDGPAVNCWQLMLFSRVEGVERRGAERGEEGGRA